MADSEPVRQAIMALKRDTGEFSASQRLLITQLEYYRDEVRAFDVNPEELRDEDASIDEAADAQFPRGQFLPILAKEAPLLLDSIWATAHWPIVEAQDMMLMGLDSALEALNFGPLREHAIQSVAERAFLDGIRTRHFAGHIFYQLDQEMFAWVIGFFPQLEIKQSICDCHLAFLIRKKALSRLEMDRERWTLPIEMSQNPGACRASLYREWNQRYPLEYFEKIASQLKALYSSVSFIEEEDEFGSEPHKDCEWRQLNEARKKIESILDQLSMEHRAVLISSFSIDVPDAEAEKIQKLVTSLDRTGLHNLQREALARARSLINA